MLQSRRHLILVNNDLLGHAIHNLGVELDGMIPREANLLSKVIGQNADEVAVSAFIKEGLVRKLRVFVAEARRRLGVDDAAVVADRKVKMQGWRRTVSQGIAYGKAG